MRYEFESFDRGCLFFARAVAAGGSLHARSFLKAITAGVDVTHDSIEDIIEDAWASAQASAKERGFDDLLMEIAYTGGKVGGLEFTSCRECASCSLFFAPGPNRWVLEIRNCRGEITPPDYYRDLAARGMLVVDYTPAW